jgi:large subunit ribosomal protein L3
MDTVLGQKKTIGQKFLENGTRIPVTEIVVPQAPVLQRKTVETDGYNAVQIGYGTTKKPTKALLGHAKKANLESVPRKIQEVRVEADFSLEGNTISVSDVLKPGDIVQVTGMSKGKGWAGGVKRYGFKGGPRTHGQSDRERAPGSIGQTTTPGRVYKGKRMAGRMGHEQVTVKNLIVVDVTGETVLVSGLVPGIKNSMVTIKKIGEVPEKKYVPLLKPHEEVVPEPTIEEVVETPEVVAQVQEESVAEAPETSAETIASVEETPSEDPEVASETVEETKTEETQAENTEEGEAK